MVHNNDDVKDILSDLGIDDEIVDLEDNNREELKKKVEKALYSDESSLDEEQERKIKKVLKENEMEKEKNIYREILSKPEFRGFEVALSAKSVITYAEGILQSKISVQEVVDSAFYNTYLEPYKDITEEEKATLLSEYYPSFAQFSTGAKVNKLLIAELDKTKELNSDKSNSKKAFLWKSNTGLVNNFYKSGKHKLFGSKTFIPMLNEQDLIEKDEKYFIYLSTINTILEYLGLSVSFLKEHRIGISIGTQDISEGSSFGGSNYEYAVRFLKE